MMKREYLNENVYEALQRRLKFLFEEFDNIFVSFSGGKDSGLLLNLVLDFQKAHYPDKRIGELSVIGANDFYDTLVDDRIVARKTLHGQYIEQIRKAGKLKQLESTIEQDALLNKPEHYQCVPGRQAGRKVRYPLGSVVEFENYVLTAFTKFDEDNKAYLSAEEYVGFWMQFWKNIDEIYAGRTLNIPLMGAGITRFRDGKPSKQELLEVMLWTLKISGFHNTYSDGKVNIVIYRSDVKDIDFYHIQHNLSLE